MLEFCRLAPNVTTLIVSNVRFLAPISNLRRAVCELVLMGLFAVISFGSLLESCFTAIALRYLGEFSGQSHCRQSLEVEHAMTACARFSTFRLMKMFFICDFTVSERWPDSWQFLVDSPSQALGVNRFPRAQGQHPQTRLPRLRLITRLPSASQVEISTEFARAPVAPPCSEVPRKGPNFFPLTEWVGICFAARTP